MHDNAKIAVISESRCFSMLSYVFFDADSKSAPRIPLSLLVFGIIALKEIRLSEKKLHLINDYAETIVARAIIDTPMDGARRDLSTDVLLISIGP